MKLTVSGLQSATERAVSAMQKAQSGFRSLAIVLHRGTAMLAATATQQAPRKEPTMTTSITSFRSRLAQHLRYRRTVSELRALPMSVKFDLDIAGIEDRIAREAVYR